MNCVKCGPIACSSGLTIQELGLSKTFLRLAGNYLQKESARIDITRDERKTGSGWCVGTQSESQFFFLIFILQNFRNC